MNVNSLSSNEKIIIKRIAQLQIQSFTRLADRRDPLFEEMKEDFAEGEGKITDLDIDCQLTQEIVDFEKVFEEPSLLFKLDKLNLMVAQYIIVEGVEDEKYRKTKIALLQKLQTAQELQDRLN